MPSFDIVSEVDKQELDNAVNQTRKELATRFDFKGILTEILLEKDKITLTAQDAGHLRGLREMLIGKLSKRGVDLRNIEQEEPAISSVGHGLPEKRAPQIVDLPVDNVGAHLRIARRFEQMIGEEFLVERRCNLSQKNWILVILKPLRILREPAVHAILPLLVQ